MVATVVNDPENFDKIANIFPDRKERKYIDADFETRRKVLKAIAELNVDIYEITYNKLGLDLEGAKKKGEHYQKQSEELLSTIFNNDDSYCVDILFDETSLINKRELKFVEMCFNTARFHNKNIIWLEMGKSSGNRTLQVQDYPTGVMGALRNHRILDDETQELFELSKIA